MLQPALNRTHKARRAASDRRIILAAIDLFAEKGYQKTTLIQIGQAAGCTGTLVSNRYGSKDGLLRVVLAHILTRFVADEDEYEAQAERMTSVFQGASLREQFERRQVHSKIHDPASAADAISTFIEAYLNDVVYEQNRIRALYTLMGEALGALPDIQPEMVKVNELFRERVAKLVRRGVEAEEFRADTQVPEIAAMIVGMLRGVTMQMLVEPSKITKEAMIPVLQRSVLSILLA